MTRTGLVAIAVLLCLLQVSHSLELESKIAMKGGFIETNRMRAKRATEHLRLGDCGPLCELDLPGIIAYYGYPVEHHTTTPDDGTVTLNMYRIPCGRGNFSKCAGSVRPPVLLQHGLLDSGTTWVLNPVESSLAFIMADNGYDVWIGNNRGTYYSPCTTDECWQFTYDEMALYDVPAHVNYILNATGFSTLTYIGHSEGTTQAFASFSTLPEVAKKINLFVALAPAVYVNHQQSPLVNLLVKFKAVYLFQLFGVKNFLPSSGFLKFVASLFCNGGVFTPLCEDIIFALCGVDPAKSHDFNSSRAEIYLTHTPAGTSVLNMAHWAQAVQATKFQMYDFGSSGNLKKYGQTSPPEYDLTSFNVPTAIYSGGQDFLADPADVMQLLQVLPKKSVVFTHYEVDYSHLDFVWGMDVLERIYTSVLPLVQTYAPIPKF